MSGLRELTNVTKPVGLAVRRTAPDVQVLPGVAKSRAANAVVLALVLAIQT